MAFKPNYNFERNQRAKAKAAKKAAKEAERAARRAARKAEDGEPDVNHGFDPAGSAPDDTPA
jgi:hypothetical protein